eukprot:365656-Chlamydomonas_euryale.AAC.5
MHVGGYIPVSPHTSCGRPRTGFAALNRAPRSSPQSHTLGLLSCNAPEYARAYQPRTALPRLWRRCQRGGHGWGPAFRTSVATAAATTPGPCRTRCLHGCRRRTRAAGGPCGACVDSLGDARRSIV